MSAGASMPDVHRGAEVVDSLAEWGVLAFTTGRAAGSFGLASDEPVRDVLGRWGALRELLGGGAARLATASQVHGDTILQHDGEWRGWLRSEAADGHLAAHPGTAMAVLVADCVPVFLAHPGGATAVLHSGWRGTAAGITERAIARMDALGCAPSELRMHCGPAICGTCYEVSPDVFGRLAGRAVDQPTAIDLRALIADRARARGVRAISLSPRCTRCDNTLHFSHRAGDTGRQLGVIVAQP